MKIALTAFVCALGVLGAFSQTANADSPAPPPRNHICIQTRNIENLSYPDDHTILFHMWAGPVKVWRNDLPHACPSLKFEQGIAYRTFAGQICSNEQVFYVLRQGTPCFMGNFSPYAPPEKTHS